jgi:DNA-nicking Smr family endonuclease
MKRTPFGTGDGGGTDGPPEDGELSPMPIPVEDSIDLHSFRPGETASVVSEYLDAVRDRFEEVRLVHGRGIGVQREVVRSLLARRSDVADFFDAPPERGGWGATVVRFARRDG